MKRRGSSTETCAGRAARAVPAGAGAHLVFIQPDMRQPQRVVGHGVPAFRRAVGPPFSEYVPDSRARDDEEFTATHPNLVGSKTRVNGCPRGREIGVCAVSSPACEAGVCGASKAFYLVERRLFQKEVKVHLLQLPVKVKFEITQYSFTAVCLKSCLLHTVSADQEA